MNVCKIKSVKKIGVEHTFNLTMESDQHNYALYDNRHDDRFVISKNSCCYAYNSYITAYLKANFPEEFMCAYMNVETRRRKLERVGELERETVRIGITLLPRDINKCGTRFEIIRKRDDAAGIARSEIRPAVHCKGLSQLAAEDIVLHRPYNSIRDLAERTDTKVVDSEAVVALCDAKFFKTNKEKLVKEFSVIREDFKQNRRKGRQSGNMFDDE